MDKVKIYLLDMNNVSLESLSSDPIFNDEDILSTDKYKLIDTKKEKLASLYLKKKYIKNFYIDEHLKPRSKDIYFNVSHSSLLVSLAISDFYEVGLDIERIKDKKDNLIDYIASKEEKDYIKSDKGFYEIWTSKESLIKCLGTGIKEELKSVPALPLNGRKIYKNQEYYSSSFIYLDYVISVALLSSSPFEVELITINK